MKVFHVTHDCAPFSLGGVEVYVHNLSRAQRAAGVEASVLSAVDRGRSRPYAVGRLTHEGVPIVTVAHRASSDRSRWLEFALDPRSFYRNARIDEIVREEVERLRPDVVHVHHLLNLSASLVETIRAAGVAVVMTLHDYWYLCAGGQLLSESGRHRPEACDEMCFAYLVHNPWKPAGAWRRLVKTYCSVRAPFFRRFLTERRAFFQAQIALADRVVSPSRFLSGIYAEAGTETERMSVSTYGIPRDDPPVRRERRKGALHFGFLGRFVPEKGLHILLEAFRGLESRARLSVIGGGYSPAGYEGRMQALGQRQGVAFPGPFPPGGARDVFAGLDVLVVPSIWWENSPLVIHEAFAAGVPVVAADAGGMKELVTDMRNGLLFEIGDARDLRAKLERLVDEPALVDQLAAGVTQPKSIEENARELLALYEEACLERVSPR